MSPAGQLISIWTEEVPRRVDVHPFGLEVGLTNGRDALVNVQIKDSMTMLAEGENIKKSCNSSSHTQPAKQDDILKMHVAENKFNHAISI